MFENSMSSSLCLGNVISGVDNFAIAIYNRAFD
jgi:hypothetical protein